MSYIVAGTHAFYRTTAAMFAGGFSTFAVLYGTQALLPAFAQEFHVSPAVASLALSVATGTLSFALVVAGTLAEGLGRKVVMGTALFVSSLIGLAVAWSPTFNVLLALRVVQGATLAGLPAVAMAYLSEEVEPASQGLAMGLYISGNSIGGLGGRLLTSTIAAYLSWHEALAAVASLALVASIAFWLWLPPSRHFEPRGIRLRELVGALGLHLQNRGLLLLYGVGFLAMAGFVTLYNYAQFELMAPPYNLPTTVVGWVFAIYLVGTFSSTFMGRMADRYGRPTMLWVSIAIALAGAVITLGGPLALKVLGIAVFTFGFFATHSIASSWVGSSATHHRAQASSLYLFFYYMGSSLGGTLGGVLWGAAGWPDMVGMLVALMATALGCAVWLMVEKRGAPAPSR